jgi:hypothetical protein
MVRFRPPAFKTFTEAVTALKFDEEPQYAAYIALFEPYIGSAAPVRPLQIDHVVGHKRGRDELAEMNQDFASGKRRKGRAGTPASQWITVYSKAPPLKQRYHYNVSTLRLETHLVKGFTEGLFISNVACCGELWAVIMDAGDSFTRQVYTVAERAFLPKDWILEQWNLGYYITSVAGASSGASLVVMSQGTTFNQQSYKVATPFPYEWIKKKWREGFFVTSMATSREMWAVVMSRGAPYLHQCVELDFQYPSEGIHRRWDSGYRISSAAATGDQAAFVLSVPRVGAGLDDETQETLRTSGFPSDHVKEKWEKNLYIAGVAYGRTVS